MAEEEEGAPLLTFPDGTDSWTTGLIFESLSTHRLILRLVSWGFATAVLVSAIAWGIVDKIEPPNDGASPFTHYSWFTLAIPLLGIYLMKLSEEAWAYNMLELARGIYFVGGLLYALILGGLFAFLIVERFWLCTDGPPWKVWCTDGGVPDPIDWEYQIYFWAVLAQLMLVVATLVLFNRISKRIKLLMHPMSGLTHEQIVRELYSTHGPRYITSIGTSVADVYKNA
jgi:hypothetical protein